MGVLDRFRESRKERQLERLVDTLQERVVQGDLSIEYLSENIAELELALEDRGWVRLSSEGDLDFSLQGIRTIIRLSRIMALKNPLIKNGVRVQQDYVFGQGVQIQSPDERVDKVVQAFLGHPSNKRVLTSHRSRLERERDLQVEGQLFVALFVNSSTGEAKVRFLPVLEVEDVICNPEDADEPWWYKRVWTERRFSTKTGTYETTSRTLYYRDWQIPKKARDIQKIAGQQVANDVWVYHLKVGALRGMKFGVPETYAAMDWARSYKDDLSNWASLRKALSRFAWKLTGKTKQQRAAKTKLSTTVGADDGVEDNPPPVTGATALTPEGMDLQAIPKTGAQVKAEDATQLRKMAAAGMGLPDNIMSSDPQQGTMATAKTLDRPTELAMRGRQMMWADVFRDLLGFVVSRSMTSPNGQLREAIRQASEADGEESSVLDITIKVDFPPVLERDIRDSVRSIVDSYTAGGRPPAGLLPPKLVTKLLLTALAVEDPEEVLEDFEPGPLPVPAADDEPDPDEPKAREDLAAIVKDLRAELTRLSQVGS